MSVHKCRVETDLPCVVSGLPPPESEGEQINGTSLLPVFEDPNNTTVKTAAFSQVSATSGVHILWLTQTTHLVQLLNIVAIFNPFIFCNSANSFVVKFDSVWTVAWTVTDNTMVGAQRVLSLPRCRSCRWIHISTATKRSLWATPYASMSTLHAFYSSVRPPYAHRREKQYSVWLTLSRKTSQSCAIRLLSGGDTHAGFSSIKSIFGRILIRLLGASCTITGATRACEYKRRFK